MLPVICRLSSRIFAARPARARHLLAFAAATVALLLGSLPATAQSATLAANWTQSTAPSGPPPRTGGAMAYDAATGQVVLFGGLTSSGALGDTWVYNGSTWTQLNPANPPSARSYASMSYDAATGLIVLFGGNSNNGYRLADTWTFDGTTWAQQNTANSPSPRTESVMAYDAATRQIVLFGGQDSSFNSLGDTWTYNGSTWTQGPGGPSPRTQSVMAYDAATRQIILFGGSDNGTNLNDTWAYNGTTWTSTNPAGPSPRDAASMAYDPVTGQLVLFGGDSGGSIIGDTWFFNGTTWTPANLATNPSARAGAAAVYDTASGQVVLFGGINTGDTELFQYGASGTPTSAVGTAAAQTPVYFQIGTAGTLPALSNANVLTQGASGLDFKLGTGSTCTGAVTAGQTCQVNFAFTPQYPGQRLGAVNLLNSSGAVIASAYISGTGTGPLATFTPGVITTVAGNGTAGYVASQDGGAATAAELGYPADVAVDAAGNLYLADFTNYRIRKVTAANGVITTVAGNGTSGYVASQDGGAATAAEINYPTGVAIDGAGNLYIADEGNNRIRKVAAATGVITTVAGNGTRGYVASQDGGAATAAELNYPNSVAVDGAGNLYIADTSNNRVREVTASTGVITTVAGNGTGGYVASQDGGPATAAELYYPNFVAVDSAGNVYIADTNNNLVRKVAASTGVITTVAGNGTYGYVASQDGGAATAAELEGPYGVHVDGGGNLYIADVYNNRVRKVTAATGVITTVAGTGTRGYVASQDGGPATAAELSVESSVTVDGAGNLYIADQGNNRIRKVSATAAPLAFPNTAIGSTSATQTVTLNNLGNANLIFPIPASGTNPALSANYTYSNSSTCPQLTASTFAALTLAPGSCTAVISFTPTAPSTSGSLVFTDNNLNATNATQTVTLTGTSTYAQPTVTAISPAAGAAGGGTSVTVTGTNLTGITSVKFGAAAASSFTLVSATSLTAVSPAGSGTVDITVANPSYTSATGTADQFRYQVYGSLRVSSFPSGTPSGVAQSVTVTALDTTGATYPSYTGTVTFSSSDTAATLPASYTFTAADGGSHTFQVTLNTGGTQSLTVSNGAQTVTQTGIVTTGYVWLVDGPGRLSKLYGNGSAISSSAGFTGGGTPTNGLAFDSSSNAWSLNSATNSLVEFTSAGTASPGSPFGGGGLNSPNLLAIDGKGQVWVTNNNGSLSLFSNGAALSPTSGFTGVTTAGTGYAAPTGVAIDASGNVWVANSFDNTLTEVLGGAAPVAPLSTALTNNTTGARP